MRKYIGFAMLLIGSASFAMAGLNVATPEIDGSTSVAALALLSGALLVIRGRKRL